MIIAIDGPAASGKSSVAKMLASKIYYSHFGTGIMYRAITAYAVDKNLLENLPISIIKVLDSINISFKDINFNKILINNSDYSNCYYNTETNKFVSEISTISEVRNKMLKIQRFVSKNKNIVCEGRDIGTVVFPNADFKFFLEGSVECRAKRRFNEVDNNNANITLNKIKKLLIDRDCIDINRKISPLKKATNAVLINTTDLKIDEVVDIMYEKIKGSI